MDIRDAIRSLFQEMIIPEFEHMKAEQQRIEERLNSVDKRLEDINIHLVDQSRRIDETNSRIDRLYEVVVRRDEHARLESRLEDLSLRVERLERQLSTSSLT
jgi:tetrahydromethanopterin S-methyltransferase subunit G